MSAAESYSVTVQESFVDDYYAAFTDFVRHVQRQGFPLSDRVLEAAHDRAEERAIRRARERGHRSVDFRPLVSAGLAKARARYGY